MAASQTLVRCAVIGCGYWGPNHIRALASLPGCRVVAAVEQDKGRLDATLARFPGLRGERDANAVFADPDIDAVVIAAQTTLHAALVRAALDAGKHVLCEKPLCMAPNEGAALVRLANARHRVLMVGHIYLFNAATIRLKRLIAEGGLGKIHHIAAVRANLGPIRADVNAAYDLASHDISILNWLLEAEPIAVSAKGSSYIQKDVEDVVSLTLEYPEGVFAQVRASWYDPVKARELTIVGGRRMVVWRELDAKPIMLYEKGAALDASGSLVQWDDGTAELEIERSEPLMAQDKAFVDAIRDPGRAVSSDGAFGLGVVRALAAARRSLARGGASVALAEI